MVSGEAHARHIINTEWNRRRYHGKRNSNSGSWRRRKPDAQLIDRVFKAHFANPSLTADDAAVLEAPRGKWQ